MGYFSLAPLDLAHYLANYPAHFGLGLPTVQFFLQRLPHFASCPGIDGPGGLSPAIVREFLNQPFRIRVNLTEPVLNEMRLVSGLLGFFLE